MKNDGTASARACAALFWAFELLLVGCLCWRALAPANRAQSGLDFVAIHADHTEHFAPRDTHVYDDVVTQVTARNFLRDGLARTHALPNRRGAPRVSLYDFTGTQCEALTPPERPLEEWNAFGQRVENVSATGDCVHLHYPPLADWIFGALAWLGRERVSDYKLLAILLNAGLLGLLRGFLLREVAPWSALLATVLAGTLPGFLSWADALYFHPFQLLFLLAGALTWGDALVCQRPARARLTFAAFFCEALVSPQAILFFGVVVAGLSTLGPASVPWRTRARGLALQALAPLAALALQASLSVSLLGFGRVAQNFARTIADRVTEGPSHGFHILADGIGQTLAPWPVLGGGILVVVAVRHAARLPLRRPLGLMATFLLGGTSFMLVFPGTARWHATSVHRLLLPFVWLVLAFLADSAGPALTLVAKRGQRSVGACMLGLTAVLLGWVAVRNARHVRQEVSWNLLPLRRADPKNLVRRSLDTIYWSPGVPRYQGFLLMPVSGLRTNEPPGWSSDFTMLGPEPSHYELWWLANETLATVRLLVDRTATAPVIRHCKLSGLGSSGFASPENTAVSTLDFVPEPGEQAPLEPYAWVRFSFAQALHTRALRLSCSGLPRLTLRQIEAFAAEAP